MTVDQPVALDLFEELVDYARTIEAGEIGSEQKLRASTEIIVFFQEFFRQYFSSQFNIAITSTGPRAKQAAVRLRRRLAQKADTESARRLIARFEAFCDFWNDGAGYQASRQEYEDFHFQCVPNLLRSIIDCAEGHPGWEPLAEAARSAEAVWDDALAAWS